MQLVSDGVAVASKTHMLRSHPRMFTRCCDAHFIFPAFVICNSRVLCAGCSVVQMLVMTSFKLTGIATTRLPMKQRLRMRGAKYERGMLRYLFCCGSAAARVHLQLSTQGQNHVDGVTG